MISLRRLSSRGETIVEVLLVSAIISLVLGTAFASTNRTLNNSRRAQEHSEGSAVAQGQLERLKSYLSSTEDTADAKFCLSTQGAKISIAYGTPIPSDTASSTYYDLYPSECKDETGRYYTVIVYDQDVRLYSVNVQWDNAAGTGRDNLDLLYRSSYIADAIPPAGGPGPGPGPAPTAAEVCLANVPSNEFHGCYYNTSNNLNPCTAASSTNFAAQNDVGNSTGFTSNFGAGSPMTGVNSDYFSACWQGSFNFATADNYIFTITTDDGIRVYIDGSLILDRFTQQATTTYKIGKDLTAGNHTVKVEYYESAGGAIAAINWGPTEELSRTGLLWVDLTEAGVPDSVANAQAATGKAYCWKVFEGAEPAGWNNNYLCSNNNLGITWKQDGPITGQFCYQWRAAPEDPHTWGDNYLCATQPLGIEFSKSGPIAGKDCIAIRENLDTDESAFWRPGTGTARLCESPTLPAEATLEVETFSNSPTCVQPVTTGGASAGQVMQYCSNFNASTTSPVSVPDFQTIAITGFSNYDYGWPVVTLRIDGVVVGSVEINSKTLRTFYIAVPRTASGSHSFGVSFDNDSCSACSPSPPTPAGDRNVYIDKLDLYRDAVIGEFEAETMSGSGSSTADGAASAGANLYMNGNGTASKSVQTGRIKAINIRARGDQYSGAPEATLRIDGNLIGTASVSNTGYLKFGFTGLNIAPGLHTITVTYNNDAYGGSPGADRNLILDKIEFTVPETGP